MNGFSALILQRCLPRNGWRPTCRVVPASRTVTHVTLKRPTLAEHAKTAKGFPLSLRPLRALRENSYQIIKVPPVELRMCDRIFEWEH
ncbi:MAG: hypothetical protein AB1646_05885 [Thermodesulfobacteriota bacterium]